VHRVSKEMWSRGNRSWHAGGARGGMAKLGQQQCDVGNAGARQHKVGRAAARQGVTRGIAGKQEVVLIVLQ
jgi:hypothetical protein